jgi:hypothetical protein
MDCRREYDRDRWAAQRAARGLVTGVKQACLCGVWGCQRHLPTWGWANKRNKAARDANYTSTSYRRLRREILSKKPPCSYPGASASRGRSTTSCSDAIPSLPCDNERVLR